MSSTQRRGRPSDDGYPGDNDRKGSAKKKKTRRRRRKTFCSRSLVHIKSARPIFLLLLSLSLTLFSIFLWLFLSFSLRFFSAFNYQMATSLCVSSFYSLFSLWISSSMSQNLSNPFALLGGHLDLFSLFLVVRRRSCTASSS